MLHLYKYRRKAPRHCQDVCIIQVRGSRENKRGRSIRNAANSWHESRTPAIQKLAHFNNFTSIKCPFNPFAPCTLISQNTQAEEILILSIFLSTSLCSAVLLSPHFPKSRAHKSAVPAQKHTGFVSLTLQFALHPPWLLHCSTRHHQQHRECCKHHPGVAANKSNPQIPSWWG